MTDNEIIKALGKEIHLIEYFDGFSADTVDLGLLKNTLDLIKRQQAEVERLKAEITRNEIKLLKIERLHNEQKAIADSHKLDMDYFMNENERLYSEIEKAKTEAITEFAERLKHHTRKMCGSDFGGEFWDKAVLVSEIDNLVKEMTEGINDT